MADALALRFDSTANNFVLGDGRLAEVFGLFQDPPHVSYGLGLSADYTNLLLDIGNGAALVEDGRDVYGPIVDARQDLSLSGSAVNDVFLVIDPSTGDISYQISTSGTPSNPFLKIGEVDTSNNTTTELNRHANQTFESVTVNGLLEAEQAIANGGKSFGGLSDVAIGIGGSTSRFSRNLALKTTEGETTLFQNDNGELEAIDSNGNTVTLT